MSDSLCAGFASEKKASTVGSAPSRRDFLAMASTAPFIAALRGQPPRGTVRPNILLVHCHDLGQYLHCYGVKTVRTPNVDRFASEGVLFRNSFCAAPQCSPSRASLFTGRYPHSNGVMGLSQDSFAWGFHDSERHLGQILKDAGYATAGIGVLHETQVSNQTLDLTARRCGLEQYSPKWFAAEATDECIAQLTKFAGHADRPFYLQVGFVEPHRTRNADGEVGFVGKDLQPDPTAGIDVPGYLADTPGTRQELAELQAALNHVDVHVGRLLAAVEDLGLTNNTMVIFTTDHGVAMPRAKCSLYDPGLEVAFILRLPSRAGWSGGKIVEDLVSNVDYLPSFLELLGLPAPANLQGRSFAPRLDGRSYRPRGEIFAEMTYHDYYDPRRCIRTATHKLIVNFSNSYFFMDPSQSRHPRSDPMSPKDEKLAFHPQVELYDLKTDRWELTNLAEKEEQAVLRGELLARLWRHLSDTGDPILKGAVTSPFHTNAVKVVRDAGRSSH